MGFDTIEINLVFPILGVVPVDLLAIIRLLAKNGQFSLTQYNEALNKLKFSSSESSDKPCPVPLSLSKKFTKLRGKAISNWVHVRNFPLIVRGFVKNKNDPVLSLGLQLHDIVERLTANEFFPHEIDLINEKVKDYFSLRKQIRDDFPNIMPNIKPKHHYLRNIHLMAKLALGLLLSQQSGKKAIFPPIIDIFVSS